MTDTPSPTGTPPATTPLTVANGAVIVGTIEEDKPPLPLRSAGGQPELGEDVVKYHRFRLALSLLVTVAIIAIGLLVGVMFTGVNRLDALKSIAGIVFGPLVTLLGTSFAWYFATKSSE